MKPIQLHPQSVLVGLAGGFFALLLMSQVTTVTFPTARVEVGPHPRDMVQIVAGTPYTVPPGKIFVLTALGSKFSGLGAGLLVNGGTEPEVSAPGNPGTPGMMAVPPGLTFTWGTSLTVYGVGSTSQSHARAWGYLADR